MSYSNASQVLPSPTLADADRKMAVVGKKFALINPNLVLQRNDVMTTGVVYMPIGLAYFAASLRGSGGICQVIDAFGANPNECREEDQFLIRGISAEAVASQIEPGTVAVAVYAINLTYHRALAKIVRAIRSAYPAVPIIVFENTQAVTGYALKELQEELYSLGVNYVITGESEERGVALLNLLSSKQSEEELHLALRGLDGIGWLEGERRVYSEPKSKIKDLDSLSFPAWDLFPLKNYWGLRYAHGPLSSKKYLPLLTSRGCPYACRFCVIPATNNLQWRGRSAKSVVDEMEHWIRIYGVREFHIEDVNPTVKDVRTREICHEIIHRKLLVNWKICAGTKIESIKSEETIGLMAQAGCSYISISPESGSPNVMKLIGKPFNYDHAVKMVGKMNKVGIKTQACFVLGFPGESDEDRLLSVKMVKDLTVQGIDEIAVFIITPVPGSAISGQFSKNYTDYSQLNFSPTWRSDYQELNKARLKLYTTFFIWKIRKHFLKLAKQPFNFLIRRFETKMEMVPYRALKTVFLRIQTDGKNA